MWTYVNLARAKLVEIIIRSSQGQLVKISCADSTPRPRLTTLSLLEAVLRSPPAPCSPLLRLRRLCPLYSLPGRTKNRRWGVHEVTLAPLTPAREFTPGLTTEKRFQLHWLQEGGATARHRSYTSHILCRRRSSRRCGVPTSGLPPPRLGVREGRLHLQRPRFAAVDARPCHRHLPQ